MDAIEEMVSTRLWGAIVQTIAYADVFDYPLTPAEVHRYLPGVRATREAVEQALHDGGFLSGRQGYYTLPGRETLVEVRRERERQAARLWAYALRYGRAIAALPFVRMVAVTGSLAVDNVGDQPDIDYLIVTAPGRLWMVRAMALAVRRLAALQGVELCPNYLITQDALAFPDRNLYAAHELAQMVPLYGAEVYHQILQANRWKEQFLPNATGLPPVCARLNSHRRDPQPVIRRVLEGALRTAPGAWFERWEMDRKIRWLTQEQAGSCESRFAADYCKGHKHSHGQRTELALRERLNRLNAVPVALEPVWWRLPGE